MRCLAIRHIACEDLGTLEAPLRKHFDAVEYIDMDGKRPPTAALDGARSADLVVSLGGPMAVYEADRYPFLKSEIDILSGRLAAGRATLGICLGSQLMAAAAGARVYSSGRQEIGWYPIHFTPETAADPVLGKLVVSRSGLCPDMSGHSPDLLRSGTQTALFFHWHGDTFDLPGRAKLIGSSERFAHQGFMIGRHGVALQFHAEVNEPILEAWLAQYKKDLLAGEGIMTAAQLREGARAHAASLEARCLAFLTAWLAEVLPRDSFAQRAAR